MRNEIHLMIGMHSNAMVVQYIAFINDPDGYWIEVLARGGSSSTALSAPGSTIKN